MNLLDVRGFRQTGDKRDQCDEAWSFVFVPFWSSDPVLCKWLWLAFTNAHPFPPKVELPFKTIERNEYGVRAFYDSQEPQVAVVSQPTDIEALRKTVSVEVQAKLQELDFENEYATVVFQGVTGAVFSPMSGVEVQRLVRQGRLISINAIFYDF